MSRFSNHEKRHADIAQARYNVVMEMTDGISEKLEIATNGSKEREMILTNCALLLCGYPTVSNSMEQARQFLIGPSLTPADIAFLTPFNPTFFQNVA